MPYEVKVNVGTSGVEQLDAIVKSVQALEGALVKTAPVLTEHEKQMKAAADAAKATTEQFKQFGESVKNFIENPLHAAGEMAQNFLGKIGPMGAAVGATGAALGAFALASFEAAKKLGELGTQINNVSIRTGLSTQEVGLFSFAAKAAGSEISSFEMAMKMLSRGLAENSEEGKIARKQLDAMGIAARDLDGNLKPMSQIFLEISDGLNRMHGTAERNAASLALFSRVGIELLPTLLKLRENVDFAKAANIELFSPEQTAKMEEYHKNVLVIKDIWGQIWHNTLGALAGMTAFFAEAAKHPPREVMGGTGEYNFLNNPGGPSAPAPPSSEPRLDLGQFGPGFGQGPLQGDLTMRGRQGVLNRGRVSPDISAYGQSLPGLTGGLASAVADEASTRSKYFAARDDSNMLTKDVEDLRQAWVRATSAVAGYQARIQALKTSSFVAGPENRVKNLPPSFFGPLGSLAVTVGESTAGTQFSGYGEDLTQNESPEQLRAVGAGYLAQNESDQKFSALQQSLGVKSRIGAVNRDAGFRSASRMGRSTANQDLEERLSIIQQIRDIQTNDAAVAGDRFAMARAEAKFEEDSADARLEAEKKIAEIQKDALNDQREFAKGLAASLFGGGDGVKRFFQAQAMKIGTEMFSNATTGPGGIISTGMNAMHLPSSQEGTLLGRLFANTPFSSKDPALTTNTSALTLLTRAVDANTTSRGGGSTGGGYGSGMNANNPFIFHAAGADGGGDSGSGVYNEMGDLEGGDSGGGVASGLGSAGKFGLGGLAIAGGAFSAFKGFSRGGASGALAGVGGTLAAAGGVASMIPGGAVVGIPLMIAGVFASVLGSFFDTKAQRQAQIGKDLANATFYDPVRMNVSATTGGHLADSNFLGQTRGSSLSPFPTVEQSFMDYRNHLLVPGRVDSSFGGKGSFGTVINNYISTVDAKGVADFFKRNSDSLAEGIVHAVKGGHRLVPVLRGSI